MQLSNQLKYFVVLAIALFMLQACGGNPAANNAGTPAADIPKSEPPYDNKEPDTYSVEVTQTTTAGVERYFIARKGDKWRVDNAYGDASQVTSMRLDKDYVIAASNKTYADYSTGHGYDERARMVEDISRGLLINRDPAVFEKLGSENGMTKYRVTGTPGKPTESIILVDDKTGLPVSREIYNLEPQRTLAVTVKLISFKKEADDKLFAIPKDYKKVTIEEMRPVLVGPK